MELKSDTLTSDHGVYFKDRDYPIIGEPSLIASLTAQLPRSMLAST